MIVCDTTDFVEMSFIFSF